MEEYFLTIVSIAAKDPSFKDLLQIIFWLASAAKEGLILKNHLFGKSLSNSWLLALKQDVVLNDTLLTGNSSREISNWLC